MKHIQIIHQLWLLDDNIHDPKYLPACVFTVFIISYAGIYVMAGK